jgi:hypothetical protein
MAHRPNRDWLLVMTDPVTPGGRQGPEKIPDGRLPSEILDVWSAKWERWAETNGPRGLAEVLRELRAALMKAGSRAA